MGNTGKTEKRGATIKSVQYTNEERAAAALRRLRVEIDAKYGSVTAFAPHVTSVKKHALLDNLNGTSMPRFNVIVEILDLLGLDYNELMRRAEADLEASAE